MRAAAIPVVLLALAACSSDTPSGAIPPVSTGGARSVACGKATCTGEYFCCGSDGWGDAACAPSCGDKHPLECDDATDCPEGNVCCFVEANGNVTSSQCAISCANQLCRATNECETGACASLQDAPSGLSHCAKK